MTTSDVIFTLKTFSRLYGTYLNRCHAFELPAPNCHTPEPSNHALHDPVSQDTVTKDTGPLLHT